MNPIDPIEPAQAAGKAAKLTLEAVEAADPSLEALTQRFQAIMKGAPQVEHVPAADGQNILSEVLMRGEDMMRRSDADKEKLKHDWDSLTTVEQLHKTVELGTQSSLNMFYLKSVSELASAANKSAQTLLKNQ